MRAAPHPKAVDGVDLCIGAKNLALKSFEALVDLDGFDDAVREQ